MLSHRTGVGLLARWWLRHFRPGYVRRMAERRRGDPAGAPHDILDPRDLKYCRNRCGCYWAPADDPFQWRNRLGFARWGLAELQLMGWPLLIATLLLAKFFWYLAPVTGAAFCLIVYFFRDPKRRLDPRRVGPLGRAGRRKSGGNQQAVHDKFLGGPAVRIGIFLSIFNVHLNRVPMAARVIALRFSPASSSMR